MVNGEKLIRLYKYLLVPDSSISVENYQKVRSFTHSSISSYFDSSFQRFSIPAFRYSTADVVEPSFRRCNAVKSDFHSSSMLQHNNFRTASASCCRNRCCGVLFFRNFFRRDFPGHTFQLAETRRNINANFTDIQPRTESAVGGPLNNDTDQQAVRAFYCGVRRKLDI